MTQLPCRPYLPPEWAPQSGIMLTWPHGRGDWAPNLTEVDPVFVHLTRHLAIYEPVLIACLDEHHRDHLRKLLQAAGVNLKRIHLHIAPSNDAWARDHGPITTVCDNEPTLLDFRFNGWGGKYDSALDDRLTQQLHRHGAFNNTPLQRVDVVLEGGSIDVDGSGTLLTTSQCLLSPTRNPDLTQAQIERHLKELLGISRILWLRHGHIVGDDTDSHIDTLARFCDRHTIAYTQCNDTNDIHYTELKTMEDELQDFRAIDDKPYQLVPLPWPQPKLNKAGQRLPATYTNFLIINGAVLVPTYDDPADKPALEQIKNCFPDRDVIGIAATPLIRQFGSLHCVTMQLPAGVLSN